MTASPSSKTEEYSVCEQDDVETRVRREVAEGHLDATSDMLHVLSRELRQRDTDEVVEELEDARAMLRIVEDVVEGSE